MMTAHLLEDERVIFIESHSRSDLGNEFNADIGVIAGTALSDVVQQGADN
jgi:hypothetical protein